MFLHIFTYRLRVLFHNKEMIFWTLLFPITLSVFFQMSLSGLGTLGKFQAISIAVVEEIPNPTFLEVLEDLSQGADPLLEIQRTTQSEGLQLLQKAQVSGLITVKKEPSLTVNQSGISQSILKSIMDEYIQTRHTLERILTENPAAAATLGETLADRRTYTTDQPLGTGDYNLVLGYYYALIAMTCFYGGFFGMEEVNQIQANLSKKGARINLAPVHKMKLFLYNLAASILVQWMELALFLSFLVFVLGIHFGPQLGLVLLTTLIGSLTGISFGAFLSALMKSGENIKNGVFIGTTMLGSFLAGLMFLDMKYLVQTSAPWLAHINPLHLLSDSYYALYIFDTYTRYAQNMITLISFILFFSIGTYLAVRRRSYASL